MIDDRRLAASLIAGLAPLIVLALIAVTQPISALGLAGDVDSPGARFVMLDPTIQGLGLDGATVEGVETTRWTAPTARLQFVFERDVDFASVVPGGGIYTLRMTGQSEWTDAALFTSRACVKGVGLTGLNLFRGLTDGAVNSAIDNGFESNLLIGLLNLIKPLRITIKADEVFGEGVLITSGLLAANQLELSHTPRRTDPVFAGSCIQ